MQFSFSPWFARMFEGMPFGRKVMMGFSFLALIGCAFPWFFEKMISYSALNHISFFGYALVVWNVLLLYLGFREYFRRNASVGGFPNAYIFAFLLGVSLYTIVLKIQVLSLLLYYSEDSQILWGGMFTFIATGMAMIGLFISWGYIPPAPTPSFVPPVISKDSLPLKPERTFTNDVHE